LSRTYFRHLSLWAGLGLGEAQNKRAGPAAAKPTAEKPPEGAKAPQEEAKLEEKKEAPKPETWRAGGVVDAADANAKILTIRQMTLQHDRTLKLKVSAQAAKGLSDLKPADRVNVRITDQVITTLTRLG
jgi:hypothetical protein